MSRTPFDQLAKQLFEELLQPFGEVQISLEVPGESHLVDIYFAPIAYRNQDRSPLGLLGEMITSPCLFEPFRNPPSPSDYHRCKLKHEWMIADFYRQRGQSVSLQELPILWIISPTLSQNFLTSAGAIAKEDWCHGVYWKGEMERCGFIAVHQLPKTPETLWLRLLGKGNVQQQAIQEVMALPEADQRREEALRLLSNWKMIIETVPQIEQEEGALTMALSQAFLEWEEKTKRKSEQRGEEKAKREIALNLLRAGMNTEQVSQFTGLSADTVEDLRQQIGA